MHFDVTSPPHIHCRFDIDWNFSFLFLEITMSCMATSYKPQAAQVNEEVASKSSLYLTLMQDFCDENLKSWKVSVRLEIDPPWAWYYCISLNSHTLVILLQVNLAFGDGPKTICEGCYKTKNTFIFTRSSILGVGHYCWLHGPIHRLLLNNKANYLVRTIRHILDFL